MADANMFHQNPMDVEDAYSCIEDPEPQKWNKIAEQEVDQPLPRIEIILNFNSGVQPPGKVLPPHAQALIGRLIYKTSAGVGYLGTVVDYDVNRRWFRIEYNDEGSEDLVEAEVRNLLATPTQVEEHLRRLRESVDNYQKQQVASAEGPSTSKTTRKRRGKCASKEGEGAYVPLSKRTRKKDH